MRELNSQAGLSSLGGYWVGIINLKSLEDLFGSLSLNTEDRFLLFDHNGTVLLDNKKSKIGSAYSNSLENKSSSRSVSNMTSQVKLETFIHFNLIKDAGNKTRSVYDKVSVDDQMWMFWKSIKIRDYNWYVVLITRI